MMNYKRLKLMRCAARVQRMHIMPTIYRQSVGEHTFGVMAILCEIMPQGADIDEARILSAALYHDSTEAITGDTPAPVKWQHPPVETALRDAEAKVMSEFQSNIHLSDYEKRVVKYADYMELVMYSLEECSTGNQAMAGVARNALNAIRNRGLIDVTPEAMRLYDLMKVKVELLPSVETLHGWPDYATQP